MIQIKKVTSAPVLAIPTIVEYYGGNIQMIENNSVEFRCDSFNEARQILNTLGKEYQKSGRR